MTPGPGEPALRPVSAEELVPALRAALAGGPAVVPLPADKRQATRLLDVVRPTEPLEVADVVAVVSTSGSTGTPKGVLLTRAAVLASAAATHGRLFGPGRWLLALPLNYVAGLMVAVRALAAGGEPVPVGAGLEGLADLPRVDAPTYLSLVPAQLARALERAELVAALGRVETVLVGGGHADAALLARAAAHGVRCVTTYGMAETCGGCVYDGVALDGMTVRLAGDRIVLDGPMVFSGYRLAPDRTAEVLTPDGVLTADRGRIVEDRLTVLGRIDDVVVSGGVNVDLAELERALQARVDRHLVVTALYDDVWGVRIVALTDDTRSYDLAELLALAELDGAARPRELVRVRQLPRTATGKVDRLAILELLATLAKQGRR